MILNASLQATDVKPFIGAKDFQLSKVFYNKLGWTTNFDSPDIAELQLGDCRLYLQNYYHKQWCHNTMLHITVEDAHAWFDHAQAVIASSSFGEAKVQSPELQSYGALVTFVWDPAGVLLHFSQYTD